MKRTKKHKPIETIPPTKKKSKHSSPKVTKAPNDLLIYPDCSYLTFEDRLKLSWCFAQFPPNSH